MMRDPRWKQYAPTISEEPFVVRDGYYDPLDTLYRKKLNRKMGQRSFSMSTWDIMIKLIKIDSNWPKFTKMNLH